MKKIIFVTSNSHKVKEADDILKNVGISVVQKNSGYPELQENELEPIALYGAKWACDNLNCEVMVDDSGLFIDCLGGFPGPYSAYVLKTLGNSGILKLMENEKNRNAAFKCVIGYCCPNSEPVCFSGEVKGKIAYEIKGNNGFGYDPIFEVDGLTFGEIDEKEKNKQSHRYMALMKFAEWLK